MSKEMTKVEWFKAILDGATGKFVRQGTTVFVKYDVFDGSFKAKRQGDYHWSAPSFRGSRYKTVYTIIEDTELTIKEIEQQLGITNLKIVGDK